MADEQDQNDDELDTEPAPESGNDLAAAKAAAARAKKREDATKREMVFVKAGIDTDTPKGQAALKAYDGELSKDAVAAWYGEVFGAPAIRGDEPSPAEVALTDDRQYVATGGDPGPGAEGHEHPHLEGITHAGEVWRQTFDVDKAAAAFLGPVFTAAAQGDARVLLHTINADGAQRPIASGR
jgi:hypothetical protein